MRHAFGRGIHLTDDNMFKKKANSNKDRRRVHSKLQRAFERENTSLILHYK